jgi:two-component system chemotaxis sensor kinase CheA
MDEMQEIMEDFLIEAFEMIEQLDQDLVELESNPDDLDLLNKIFRVAHTIKGSGSFLNLDVLTRLTHHMEDVLNKARKGELKITPDIMDVILESVDMMKALLENIRDTGSDVTDDIDIEPVVTKLDAISQGKSLEETPQEPEVEVAQEESVDELTEEDYANMSPEEIEAEIERLLKQRQEEDKKRREAKKKQQNGDEKKEEKSQTPAPKKETKPTPKKEEKKIFNSCKKSLNG